MALAPDLYHGEKASEPDEAGKLMMALNLEQAAKDMSGAVDNLVARGRRGSDRVGRHRVLHGRRARAGARVAASRRDQGGGPLVRADPRGRGSEPDWSTLDAAVLGHYAGNDDFFRPDLAEQLQQNMQAARASTRGSTWCPAPTTRSSTTRAPRSTTPRPSAAGVARDARLLPREARLSGHSGEMTDVVGRYIELGLRLGRHVDGFVDAYYGPPELAAPSRGRAAAPARGAGGRGPSPPRRPRRRRRCRPARCRAPTLARGPRRWACAPARASWRARHRLPRRGRVLLRRPPRARRRGRASRPRTARLDEVLPGRRRPLRRALHRLARGAGRAASTSSSPPSPRWPRTSGSAPQRLFGLPDGEHVDFELRDRQAVVGLQLLPGRAAQPGRHQHRPAGPVADARPPRRPRGLSRATTPSTPARRSAWSASAAGSRRRSSSSARRSACWPRASPTSGSRSWWVAAGVGGGRAPAAARHPLAIRPTKYRT